VKYDVLSTAADEPDDSQRPVHLVSVPQG